MTGYGEATTEVGSAHFFLELRSLNNRYFKSTIRLQDEFQGLEAEFEAALRRKVSRGSVTLIARCSDSSSAAAFVINHEALANYVDQLKKTPQVASGEVRIDLGPLLNLPGVMVPPSNEEARLEQARSAFTALLDKACAALIEMRTREGRALVEDLLVQRDVIDRNLEIIKDRSPQTVQDYELRLKSRIEMMLKDARIVVEPAELIKEIAVYAERSDISEEIQRLTEHVKQFNELVTASGGRPVGRTLDFLAQEMLREANTMASKSADSLISRSVVEIKGSIDRIKEQVQNVE
ncbi:YicC family protein [soil metagenome]